MSIPETQVYAWCWTAASEQLPSCSLGLVKMVRGELFSILHFALVVQILPEWSKQ
jgi:hypothetical protein